MRSQKVSQAVATFMVLAVTFTVPSVLVMGQKSKPQGLPLPVVDSHSWAAMVGPENYARIEKTIEESRNDQLIFKAKFLGTFRITYYAKGQCMDGSPFTGKYHTCAARLPGIHKSDWLAVQLDQKRVLVYVNDTFGVVRSKGRDLEREEVAELVDEGVLSACDLAWRAAYDLGATGNDRAMIWQVQP